MNYAYRVNISVKLHGCVGWSGPASLHIFKLGAKRTFFFLFQKDIPNERNALNRTDKILHVKNWPQRSKHFNQLLKSEI